MRYAAATPPSVECELHSALHIISKFRTLCGAALLLHCPAGAVFQSSSLPSRLLAKLLERGYEFQRKTTHGGAPGLGSCPARVYASPGQPGGGAKPAAAEDAHSSPYQQARPSDVDKPG